MHASILGNVTRNSVAGDEIEFLEPSERCSHVALRGLGIHIVLLRQCGRNIRSRTSALRLLPDERRRRVQLVDEFGTAIQYQHFTVHLA